MPETKTVSCNKPVSYPFDRNDLQRGVLFQVSPDFGNVYVQIAAVKKGVVPPDMIKQVAPVDHVLSVPEKIFQ